MTAADTHSNGLPAGDRKEVLLDLEGVSAGYGRTTVLRDVSVSVPRGSVVALLGANGAGKTTLLRTAAGLVRPIAGTVRIHGKILNGFGAAERARAGLCLVPEGRGIFRDLTVKDNLRIQRPQWVKADHSEEVIAAFPVLGARLHQQAGSLSGGEQQMLALGRTFMAEPSIVLLDEVSMGLAPVIVDQIFEILRRLREQGVSLLLVEQYVDRALDMADAVVLLDRGRVSFSGLPGEIDHDSLLRNYLGTAMAEDKE